MSTLPTKPTECRICGNEFNKAVFTFENHCPACESKINAMRDSGECVLSFAPDTYCSCSECDAKERLRAVENLRRNEAERLENNLKTIRALVVKHTPPIFRSTNTDHPRFNKTAWEKIKDWEPTSEKPWLGLIGATGTCKSRIAYMLASAVIEKKAQRLHKIKLNRDSHGRLPSFAFVTSYNIAEHVLAQYFAKQDSSRSSSDERPRDFLDELRTVNLLLIDDLGKIRATPAVAAEMFALIDHRYQHQLSTIWTANNSTEEIAASMTEDMAAPFAGRLNDSSRIIRLK